MINYITRGIISLIIPLLYFIIIGPISLLFRFFNIEFIPINFDKNKNSYWLIKHKIRHDKKKADAEDFYKQF